MDLEEFEIVVDGTIKLQPADKLVKYSDSTTNDCSCPFSNLVHDIGVLAHSRLFYFFWQKFTLV